MNSHDGATSRFSTGATTTAGGGTLPPCCAAARGPDQANAASARVTTATAVTPPFASLPERATGHLDSPGLRPDADGRRGVAARSCKETRSLADVPSAGPRPAAPRHATLTAAPGPLNSTHQTAHALGGAAVTMREGGCLCGAVRYRIEAEP